MISPSASTVRLLTGKSGAAGVISKDSDLERGEVLPLSLLLLTVRSTELDRLLRNLPSNESADLLLLLKLMESVGLEEDGCETKKD